MHDTGFGCFGARGSKNRLGMNAWDHDLGCVGDAQKKETSWARGSAGNEMMTKNFLFVQLCITNPFFYYLI